MKKTIPFFKKLSSFTFKKIFILFFLLSGSILSFACDRPNVSDLTGSQQSQLIDLILEFACEGQAIYGGLNGMDYHGANGLHGLHTLLPWHGNFIAELEAYLLNNGGAAFVPLPEWDPCVRMPNIYYDEESVCGGVDPLPELPKLEAPACRGFNGDTYSCKSLCEFETIDDFLNEARLDHNFVHNIGVGGSMSMLEDAAGTAIFYPWHKYLDNIWKDYQNANFMDLEADVEVIYDDCCEVQLSIPSKCCLSIESVSMEDGTFVSIKSGTGGNMIATFIKDSPGTKDVVVTYRNACDELGTVGTNVTVNAPANVPSIPSVPPYGFEDVCMEQPNCYDFKWIKCLKSLEVSSSSFKLNVEVNGTEVCLTSIFPKRETVILTVTPIGYCGAGEPQQWTIHVNDPNVCGGFDDGGHFRRPDISTETSLISLYPNPVNDQLNIDLSLANETTAQLRIVDILGKVQYTSEIKRTTGTEIISTNDLAPGVYYLSLFDGEKIIENRKFVKN